MGNSKDRERIKRDQILRGVTMYAYSRIEYENEVLNEIIEKEMHNTKRKALEKLASMCAHSTGAIAKILAYSYFESLDDAVTLADRLDLCKLDFLAIQEDLEAFKEEWLSNQEEAQNF
jgi:hypothetical protein